MRGSKEVLYSDVIDVQRSVRIRSTEVVGTRLEARLCPVQSPIFIRNGGGHRCECSSAATLSEQASDDQVILLLLSNEKEDLRR